MTTEQEQVTPGLRSVIGRFKFIELETAVLPSFPEVKWQDIKQTLVKNRQDFTTGAFLKVLEQNIKAAKITKREMKNRLCTLQLVDVSRHSMRKNWWTYRLEGEHHDPQQFESDRYLQEKISKEFNSRHTNVQVRVMSHDNITFISVHEAVKKKSRISNRDTSTYIALFKGERYLFVARKSVDHNTLLIVTQCLHYDIYKRIKLSGRHLKSLIQLLRAKQQGTVNDLGLLQTPAYKVPSPIVRSTGIDFTESKQRREYIDKLYGSEPPRTESLVVGVIDQKWQCSDLVPGSETDTVDIHMEFRSNNIPRMMKDLVQRRVVQIPLPAYAEQMLTLGKNEVAMHL